MAANITTLPNSANNRIFVCANTGLDEAICGCCAPLKQIDITVGTAGELSELLLSERIAS